MMNDFELLPAILKAFEGLKPWAVIVIILAIIALVVWIED